MSYCVNCGVELDKTCSVCPLCHTKVYHPEQPVDTISPPPFPTKKGVEEPVHRYELTILVTIILVTTSIVCTILNHYTFTRGQWSTYVVGACIVTWFLMLPVFFPQETNPFINILIDGFCFAAYFFVISERYPGNRWYSHIILPVIILITISFQIYYLFAIKLKGSMICRAVVLLSCTGIFCMVLELLLDSYLGQSLTLSWAAIVLTCCVSIDIILITIACLKGIRSEFRRRMHF